MAYAAVLSLMHTFKETLESACFSSETLESALHHAKSLNRTLKKCSELVGYMDEQMIIIEAAIKLQDAIEFSLLSQPPTFSSNLYQDIDCFIEAAKETKQIIEGLWEQRAAKMIEEDIEDLFLHKPDPEEEEEDVEMVGLCDQFLEIRNRVLRGCVDYHPFYERVIWISGMAGVGKTALAKKVFHDPRVKTFCEHRAFVRVGLKSIERIRKAITDQLNLGDQVDLGSRGINPQSLIVLDGVWDPRLLWHIFDHHQLGITRGICILSTSRKHVNNGSNYNVKMRFMNEEESWELLRRKVFGEEEDCPPQLVKPGKKIAKKCEGLPLLINAVAPILLSKAQKDLECWNKIAQKPDSVIEEASHQISQVLLKSYNQIPEVDKLCFLYITSFPLHCVVLLSMIEKLWFVERFIKYSWTYSVGQMKYYCTYKHLIDNNLVINCNDSWAEAEAFELHCSYWYVSRRVAENNKFFYVIKSYPDDLDESIKSHRRLAIQENVLLAIKEVQNKIASIANVRSLLCTGPYNQYEVPICWEWKLLRVLLVLTIRFYEFPVEVVDLIRLKYLALTCNANLPRSISKLSNLEFLIIHRHLNIKRVAAQSYLPVEIWYLEKLIHLEIPGRNLPDPPPGVVLDKLEALLDVGVESCTKNVLESIPELMELRIPIELAPNATQISSCFDYIPSHLKSFQSVIVNPTLLSPPPPLLIGSHLIDLSLSGFGYPWEDMSKIAEIKNLQRLKLECYAFRGEKWEAKQMKFPELTHLLIEDTDLVQWTARYETFRELRKLTMKNCHKLREIPIRHRLPQVELIDCNPLAETWAKQWDRWSVKYSWKEKVKS